MARAFDLASRFVHLADGGGACSFAPDRAFWTRTGASYDRVIGALDFASPQDLHASMEEVHPDADELIVLVSGAIDVVLDEDGGERRIALELGQAAIVPRGVWHQLVMRRPGRLVFVNSRKGMQSRRAAKVAPARSKGR